ncbi:ATP synthase F1 subunit epsilon [Myxococcota bacterium]|nr:ATP synthase F1 subunit epsilon [Myxococcota bacterium]
MADQSLQLDVITPERQVFSGEVSAVIAPGARGQFGVLGGHVRYVTEVHPGPLTFDHGGRTHRYVVGGGFAQVGDGRVMVLADRCEEASTIDVEQARRDMAAAEKTMLESLPTDRAYLDAQAAQRLAIARIQAATGAAASPH